MAAGTDHRHDQQASVKAGYEVTDVQNSAIWYVGLFLVFLTVITLIFVWFFMKGMDVVAEKTVKTEPLPSVLQGLDAQLPPSPRLQVNPTADMQEWHKHEQAVLSSYAWVDQEKGIVQVPIAVAMDMVLEKGLPTAENATTATTPSVTGRQENWDSSGGQAGRW